MAKRMKYLNNLRWLLGLPFIGVAWLFYKLHEIIDPYTNWELGQYELWTVALDDLIDELCDDEDCC